MSYAERDDGLKTNTVRAGCLLNYFSKPQKVYVYTEIFTIDTIREF